MSRNIGRKLTERRQSNAAGPHGKKTPDRYNTEREVIAEAMDEVTVDGVSLGSLGDLIRDYGTPPMASLEFTRDALRTYNRLCATLGHPELQQPEDAWDNDEETE